MKKKTDPNERQRLHDVAASPMTTPRRRVLKRLAAGGAAVGVVATLPTRWTRPVVKSVVLPAHAQLSGEPDGDFFMSLSIGSNTGNFMGRETRLASGIKWLEWLIPGAHAGRPPPPEGCVGCAICGRLRGGEIVLNVVGLESFINRVCYTGEGGIGDSVSFSLLEGSAGSCTTPPPITIARLQGAAPNRTLVLDNGSSEFSLDEDPSRTCRCDELECPDLSNCLLHGTPVLLPGGRSRSIETLSVGSIVAAFDRGTRGIRPAVVTKIMRNHLREAYWRVNDSLLITNDHPVLTVDEAGVAWRRVDELVEGMEIQGVRGRTTIVSLEHVAKPVETVYMETTADNFIAVPNGAEFVVKAGYGAALERRRERESEPVHA